MAKPPGDRPSLFHDAVLEVRYPGCLDRAELFKLQVRSDSVEETLAAAQDERRDVDLDFVDEPGRQVLVDDAGAAADVHVLVAGGLLGLLEGRLNGVGDEGECRVGERQWLALVVCDDEDGLVEGRVLAPPSIPRLLGPRPAARRAELAAAHDLGADVVVRLLEDGAAGVDLAALSAVGFPPSLEGEHPVVNLLAALAERIFIALVGPGDVAVCRNRYVHPHLAHVCVDISLGRNSSVRLGFFRGASTSVRSRASGRRSTASRPSAASGAATSMSASGRSPAMGLGRSLAAFAPRPGGRSRSWRTAWATTASRPDPLQEQGENPGSRSPDQLVRDQVGVGLDRDSAPDEAPLLVGGLQVVERGDEHALHLRRVRLEAHSLFDQSDEGVDLVVGDEGADRRQGANNLDVVAREGDLLLGLAQGGVEQLLALITPPARE